MDDNYSILILLLFIILIFFILRELFCWYWKINTSIELQKEILKELRKLNGHRPPSTTQKTNTKTLKSYPEKTEEKGSYPIVVEIETGQQMTVREIAPDGKLLCYSGNFEIGTFSPEEVMDLDEWTSKNKK